MDMGNHALAGGFLKKEQFDDEKRYPLRLFFCEECCAVQVADVIEPDTLFRDYFYFSSSIGTLRQHFKEYADDVYHRFLPKSVLEIGCNDGVLLKNFADYGVQCIGVDPATNVVSSIQDDRLKIHNAYFDESIDEKVNLIVANNVFAHIPDINGATRAVKKCLTENGVFVFEVHYVGKMVSETQYDIIYNEHLYYHSLTSLQNHFNRHGMTIFDVEPIDLHAGSMRYYVCKDSRAVLPSVHRLEMQEMRDGLHRIETYLDFADRSERNAASLYWTLNEWSHSTVAGYGASGRANTIMQFAGVKVDYMVDDAPKKWGYFTPGTHIEIRKELGDPDCTVIFAWPFQNEILQKVTGSVILPMPEVKTLLAQERIAV